MRDYSSARQFGGRKERRYEPLCLYSHDSEPPSTGMFINRKIQGE